MVMKVMMDEVFRYQSANEERFKTIKFFLYVALETGQHVVETELCQKTRLTRNAEP